VVELYCKVTIGYNPRLHAGAHGIAGGVASVRLKAGGGALLRLAGEGCAAAVSSVRRWRFDPRTLSTKGGQELQDLGGKQSTYSRFGAGRRHYAPGGPAGWESNYILGGSYWETGGLKTEAEAIAFTQAGFSVASINEAGLKSALGYAAAYGNFVFATTQTPDNKSQVMSASDALRIGERYGCHTNLLGVVVADSGAAALASAAATTGALKEFNWMFPLVPSVESVAQAQVRKTLQPFVVVFSVSHGNARANVHPLGQPDTFVAAQALAAAGITPLPAVSLPSTAGVSSASAWGQATLDLLSDLGAATANRSTAASMAVTIDACGYASESLHRAAAYWSAVWGAQAIWWEGLGRCAAVGSAKFELVASINRRLTQVGSVRDGGVFRV
jgi:hypothetical protein